MKRIALLAALIAFLPLPASAGAASVERQVDALFARWNRPGVPGAVVGVLRDGKVVLSRAYGMADIERGMPITADTVFTVGSMSKQFTAFAVQLLAQDGRLSLDDDVRTYLPEVPDFGAKITLGHLLHHTSGLRDHFGLLFMAGWHGVDDVVTDDDVLALVKRQRALNFAPGSEHLYSNTGYVLLARVVERVSGKPLADFARERMFEPLGMRHTRFLHGYGTLVPRRASSYVASADGGYESMTLADSADGAGGLVTTLGDLALWDRNFYDGRVGGTDLIARMQETAVLSDGSPVNYASGLFVDTYRGRRLVEHSGMGAGFQAQLLRFPDQHVSVAVLANTSDLDSYRTSRTVADLVLDGAPSGEPPAPPTKTFREVAVDPARLDALTGFYALSPESGIQFSKVDGRLMAQATGLLRIPVFAYGERAFFAKAVDAQFTFDAPGPDGVVAGGVLHQDGRDIPARRAVRPAPPSEALRKYEGDFYSDELHVVYTVANGDGGLVLTYPRGEAALEVNDRNRSATGLPFGAMQYQCGGNDGCTGFTVSNPRVRNLQFIRMAPAALR